MKAIPFAVTEDTDGLDYFALEISYAGSWINLNDHVRYKVGADGTRDQSAKTWRKITAQSPVLAGNYLVHAVPEMIMEQISVFVYGNDQTDLSDNLFHLEELFEQHSFQLRWTLNEYREYWRCQLAEASSSRGQVWSHSQMAVSTFSVPRYPDVTRERI